MNEKLLDAHFFFLFTVFSNVDHSICIVWNCVKCFRETKTKDKNSIFNQRENIVSMKITLIRVFDIVLRWRCSDINVCLTHSYLIWVSMTTERPEYQWLTMWLRNVSLAIRLRKWERARVKSRAKMVWKTNKWDRKPKTHREKQNERPSQDWSYQ